MKTVYLTGTVILATALIISMRFLPKRIDASMNAKTAQADPHVNDEMQRPPYLSPYPISDQAKSLARFAREQVSLTPQPFQLPDSSPDTVQDMLSAMGDGAEPRPMEWKNTREKFPPAPIDQPIHPDRIFLLEERIKLAARRLTPDAELTAELNAMMAREREALPVTRENFERIDNELNKLWIPALEKMQFVVPEDEWFKWDAARSTDLQTSGGGMID